MRRLALIVTCIAVLGAGAAVWISGASAGAAVAYKPMARAAPSLLKQLSTLTGRLPLRQTPLSTVTVRAPKHQAPTVSAVPPTCYVAGGGCSLHPCVEFATSSSAVYQIAAPNVTAVSPALSARSRCRSTGSGVARVSLGVVTARPVR